MKHPPARASVDRLFRAFADLTRLRILSRLRERELCVGDVVGILRVPQARVSRHLAYLRRAGLVRVREDGLWSFYSLAPARSRLHRRLLDCLAGCFRDVPGMASDARRARKIARSGGCCPR